MHIIKLSFPPPAKSIKSDPFQLTECSARPSRAERNATAVDEFQCNKQKEKKPTYKWCNDIYVPGESRYKQ